MRHFIRFGDIPEGNRSRMWTAPNTYMYARRGQVLPGLSAYEAKRRGRRWELITDDINVGSGIASLSECFYRSVSAPDANPIYLLKGTATTWRNMTAPERKAFADWYPGRGCEGFDILGTDGEPLVRDFDIVSKVKTSELICGMVSFPEDWEDELNPPDERVHAASPT